MDIMSAASQLLDLTHSTFLRDHISQLLSSQTQIHTADKRTEHVAAGLLDAGLNVIQQAPVISYTVGGIGLSLGALWVLNFLSYKLMKRRILDRQTWDLNICCGKTDGGGVNADIFKHCELPNYVQVTDVCNLPFDAGRFDQVLSSHTIEHVDDPMAFYKELKRVGRNVTIVIPPLWDISAVLNVLEHQHIFLSMRKEHTVVPRFVRLPLARTIQSAFGQRIHA